MGFVTVNDKGLVVIPKAVRQAARIGPGDKLQANYDEASDTVNFKKIRDVKEISASVRGMWKDNRFDGARTSMEDRIDKILKK